SAGSMKTSSAIGHPLPRSSVIMAFKAEMTFSAAVVAALRTVRIPPLQVIDVRLLPWFQRASAPARDRGIPNFVLDPPAEDELFKLRCRQDRLAGVVAFWFV